MGLLVKLVKRVKNICILCIVVNLLLILITQCYLLFEARLTAKNNLFMETETLNQLTKNESILENDPCTHKVNTENKRLYYEYKYRSGYVTMIGTISILEVFVDLPINILLVFAVYSNMRKLLIPWLIFNSFKIIASVVIACLFVIYVIVGVDHFKSSKRHYDILIKPEDNQTSINKEKRYTNQFLLPTVGLCHRIFITVFPLTDKSSIF